MSVDIECEWDGCFVSCSGGVKRTRLLVTTEQATH